MGLCQQVVTHSLLSPAHCPTDVLEAANLLVRSFGNGLEGAEVRAYEYA